MPAPAGRAFRSLSHALVALGSVCALLCSPAHAVTIRELPLDMGGSLEANDLLATPDGGAWVVLAYPGALVRVDAGGAVLHRYPIDARGASGVNTADLASGPDGRPWFTISRTVGLNTTTTIAT